MSTPRLGCIADDFTGATDLANNLARQGMRTVQTIGVLNSAEQLDADAIVVALKSRTIAPADAVRQSLDALRWLQGQGVAQIYFKYCSTFDSTPHGNIGPVTDALLDALHGVDKGFTIVCPAFPKGSRTVFKGHLFVGDQLLSDSGMREHPLTPMTDANLLRVMQAQTRRRVGLVTYDVVARGADALREAFRGLQQQGVGVAVVDAVSDADLHVIGAAVRDMPLVTAASGVAIGLPANWGLSAQSPRVDLPPARGKRAVLSGSCSVATRQQVQHVLQQGLPSFQVDPLALDAGYDVVTQALQWAQEHAHATQLLVYATAEPQQVREVQQQMGVQRAGTLVEVALAEIAVGLVQGGVRQLVVAGGETSGAVVQALQVDRMRIGMQIDPGVCWTTVQSPVVGGETVHLALKSGNFGSVDVMCKAFGLLEQTA